MHVFLLSVYMSCMHRAKSAVSSCVSVCEKEFSRNDDCNVHEETLGSRSPFVSGIISQPEKAPSSSHPKTLLKHFINKRRRLPRPAPHPSPPPPSVRPLPEAPPPSLCACIGSWMRCQRGRAFDGRQFKVWCTRLWRFKV